MSSNNQAPPPSNISSIPNSETSSTDQTTTTVISSSSSVTPPPIPPTSGGNLSQTATDTTTTSSVFESESAPLSSASSISTTNNDGSTSVSSMESMSVTLNSSPENIPSSTFTTESITTTENAGTDTITGGSAPTSTTPEVPTTTASEETETTASTATTISTNVTDTTSETATSVSEPTSVTSSETATATTVSEPTSVTDSTSGTATTVSETATVTDTASETATTVSETATVTDTASETATTTSEPTTVTDTASETVTTVSEPTSTTTFDVTTTATDTGTGSSTVVVTESQTIIQTPTETQTETVTKTESGTTLTGSSTLPGTQTATETSSAARSDTLVTSTFQTVSSPGSSSISTGISRASSSGSGPSTLVVSTSGDILTDVNTSNLDILTQNSLPTAEALSLSSMGITFTTTEFATSTLSDGKVTLIPTMTRTVTGGVKPTYTLQSNDFERNKGTIVGVIVATVVLAVVGIFVGIWYCRRRRGRMANRRSSLSPFAEVAPAILIPGHPSVSGDRSSNSHEWRSPLVGEVGDNDDATTALRNVMSERSSASGHILPVSYRDRPTSPPLDSSDVVSLASLGQASAIQFGTSLLSFDGPQQTNAIKRFSDSSSMEGGVRTASSISLSAEQTQIGSQFSHGSSTSGTIPIISPFADCFSTQEAARNSYWGTTRPSVPQSLLSGEDTASPKRSDSMGSQRSYTAQSITNSERGWKTIEIDETVPRPPGRAPAPTSDVVVHPVNPFEIENTPSLMSQVSLLNPPTRPPFHTTITDIIHQSRPPMLPEIPAGASPALTDDSFHPEGLLADHLYVQNKGQINSSRGSFRSLLDHVDYSRPIVDSPRLSMMNDGDLIFRMSGGTENGGEEVEKFDSTENPFRDPVPNDEDLFNDVSPVLTMIRRVTASRTNTVNSSIRT